MFFKNRIILLVCFIFLVFISISSTFAIDNETLISNDDLERTDIYFNASAQIDGDGSKENPYNELKESRIINNSNIYLAEGSYDYNPDSYSLSSLGHNISLSSKVNISFYGQNIENTIIKSRDNFIWQPQSYFLLNNLTLINTNIAVQNANLIVDNVIFKNSNGVYCDNYHNYLGGSIFASNTNVCVSNSQFINTSSEYGGAIYITGGVLEIINTTFTNISSTYLGGAITCQNNVRANISKTKFNNINAGSSDGGSIYLYESTLKAYDLDFTNSSAGFGGAICSLNSTITLENITFNNNHAKYFGSAVFAMYGDLNILNSSFANNENMSIVVNNVSVNFLDNDFFEDILAYNSIIINNTELNIFNIDKYSFNRVSSDYSLFNFNLNEFAGELPEYYSLVDDGYVTSVKNQKNGGNCWSFTAMAILESCILKLTNTTYDLSEENLKNVMAYYSNWGWDSITNDGGKVGMVTGYLSGWLGPVLDITDKYSDRSYLSNVFDAILHIDNIILLKRNNFTDNDDVKRAILTYGAVGGDLYYSNMYLNESTNGYYYYDSYSSNHAVTIVGWNDTYSKENFLTKPAGDGAWIVKNSWGEDWGDNGYFYVSYYDESVSHGDNSFLYTILLNNTRHYDKNYQYDLGYSQTLIYSIDSFLYKNIFNSTDEEYLTAISTYFFCPVNWTVSIYINDTYVVNKTGSSKAGYYTIDLGRLIKLNKGDLFTVVFNQTTLSGESVKLPLMKYNDFNKNVSTEGISYIYNGGKWVDVGLDQNAVLCIKAFTISSLDATIKLNVTGSNVTATVRDQYGELLGWGNITFVINGEKTKVGIVNGVAVLEYDFTQDYYIVTALLDAHGYVNASNNFTIIKNLDMDININDVFYGNKLIVNITLNNANAFDNDVEVKIANKTYLIHLSNQTTLYAIEDLFDVGNYSANLTYSDYFNSISKNISFNISKSINNINITVNNVTYSNKSIVTVKADVSQIYVVKINETTIEVNVVDGSGSSEISLDVGEYLASIDWNNDNYDVVINNATFNVVKQNITLDVDIKVDFNTVLITVNTSSLVNSNVSVNVSGEIHIINLTNGIANLTLNDLNQGNYDVIVLFNNNNYQPLNKTQSFSITTYNADINVGVGNITVGDNLTIQINITSQYQQKPTGNVSIFIKNFNHTINISDNNIILSLQGLSYGDYNISVVYSGDGRYSPKTVNESFSVLRLIPSISISNSITYGSNVNIVLSDGITGNLSAIVDNVSYVINIPGSNFQVNIPNLVVGSHKINISYVGSDKYSPINILSTLNVNKANTYISANSLSSNVVVLSGGISYAVTLKDNNNVLPNKEIIINFDGKSYKAFTNSKGVANFKLYSTSSGSKSVMIRFNGDSNYNSISTVKNINIAKVKTSLNVPKKTYKKSSKSKKLQATLKDSYGHIIKNAKIVFKVKSKKYSAKTNSKGIATVKVKITKKGSYKVKVSFAGDNKYISVGKSTTLKIK